MTSSGLLRHLAAYDLWANSRYVDRLQHEDDDTLDREVASSFPSLRATMLHIRDAEHTWLCRITGQKNSWPAEASMELATVLAHCRSLHDHVHQMTDEELETGISYSDLRGNVHQQPAWQLLMHCFNHSTQHRGQLITMMRSLGLAQIPANDLVAYQRTLKG